jgi:transcriptional regulator of arginine metabolism
MNKGWARLKRARQKLILEIVSSKKVATQEELARELSRAGLAATQSSVSRDVVELGLTKANGHYAAPEAALPVGGTILSMDTAGENLIVIKTEVGQAQPAALAIDRSDFLEIVGTVAGDDTILIAVKNLAAQRLAMKRILKLFARPPRRAPRTRSDIAAGPRLRTAPGQPVLSRRRRQQSA